MSTTQFISAALYAYDDSHINDCGKRIGVIRIVDTPEPPADKWIAEVYPYGEGSGRFPEHSEAVAYAKLFAAAPDMLKAIELAINIKDLWMPVNDVSVQHEGEAQALQSMHDTLKAAYLKATGELDVKQIKT